MLEEMATYVQIMNRSFTNSILEKMYVWYGMVWYGMVWYGMVWYGMVWYGMVWYGMVWYGMYMHACIYIYIHTWNTKQPVLNGWNW